MKILGITDTLISWALDILLYFLYHQVGNNCHLMLELVVESLSKKTKAVSIPIRITTNL